MTVVIAPDSFKGSLTSREATTAMKRAVLSVYPQAICKTLEISDGGEGLLTALAQPNDRMITIPVSGPLGAIVDASYLIRGNLAIIELAEAAGLLLLAPNQRNPLLTSTFGVGQLMLDAASRGATQFLIGIGGSATNDGGCGLAAALGTVFLNKQGESFIPCGGTLAEIEKIVIKKHPWSIKVACDVTNPLIGADGASAIYGPQKGADKSMVSQLDNGLAHLASFFDSNLSIIPGSGAAGGTGFGLMAFLDATLSKGIDLVLDALSFSELIRDADIVLTGEGRLDSQSLHGKVVSGIAKQAKEQKIPVYIFAGEIKEKELVTSLADVIVQITPEQMPLHTAMSEASLLLEKAVHKVLSERNNFTM